MSPGPILLFAAIASDAIAVPPAVRFTDVTVESGIEFAHSGDAESVGGGCAFLDYDGDGDQDLLLVDSTPVLYRNSGAGSFEDVTAATGLDTLSLRGMGVAAGDYDNDGDVDVFLTAAGPDVLLRNDRGVFKDVSDRTGVAGKPDRWSTSAGFFDYDDDADLDLFVFSLDGVPPRIYRNDGGVSFTDVSAESGVKPVVRALGLAFADEADGGGGPLLFDSDLDGLPDLPDLPWPAAGRGGAAWADIDGDGDLDIVLTRPGDRPMLLRNDQDLGHKWLRVKLIGNGRTSNIDAIGAWLEVRAGKRVMRRQIAPARGVLSQVELPVTFGLGQGIASGVLTITWPDGRSEPIPLEDPAGATMVIEQR